MILIVGGSHPGVEHILQEATAIDPHVKKAFGYHYMYAGVGTVVELPGTSAASAREEPPELAATRR